MSYTKWWEAHAKKHAKVLEKLKDRSKEEIIEYFSFSNMLEKEADFCLLYKDKKKCHDMKELNCYLCACPHFRFMDDGDGKARGFTCKDGKLLRSYCAIDAKNAKSFVFNNEIHQDCSECFLPHRRGFIKKYFSKNWKNIMQKSLVT